MMSAPFPAASTRRVHTQHTQFIGMIVAETSFGSNKVATARFCSSGWINANNGTGCGTSPGGRASMAGKSISGESIAWLAMRKK